jgi:uncharacterized membrane protein
MFSNKLGTRKGRWFDVPIIILCFALCFIVPLFFVYLEAWEVTFELERLIWASEPEHFYRTMFFIVFFVANGLFFVLALLSIYETRSIASHRKDDGIVFDEEKELLRTKKYVKILMLLAYAATIVTYILALLGVPR